MASLISSAAQFRFHPVNVNTILCKIFFITCCTVTVTDVGSTQA